MRITERGIGAIGIGPIRIGPIGIGPIGIGPIGIGPEWDNMGYVQWEAFTKSGPGKNDPLGPMGPNGLWAQMGPGPNRLKMALGPNGPRPK